MICRLCLVCPNTGSIDLDAFAVELLAVLCGEHASHPRVAAAVPPGPGARAAPRPAGSAPGLLVGDHLVHVLLVPVAGVGERTSGAR